MQTHFPSVNGINGINEVASSTQHATDILNQNDRTTQRIKLLEEQNEKVLSLLPKLLGAAISVDVEPRTGFQASPFIDELPLIDVPKKYTIPSFTPKYSGIIDPVEHVAQYK